MPILKKTAKKVAVKAEPTQKETFVFTPNVTPQAATTLPVDSPDPSPDSVPAPGFPAVPDGVKAL